MGPAERNTDANQEPLRIGTAQIARGERKFIQLPLPRLYTHAEMTLPVQVIRGRRDGPRLLLTATLHGDELNGIEVIREIIAGLEQDKLRGTVIAAPIINVFGFIHGSRYLPDRRDLNRSFPGSRDGSLAARIAYIVVRELMAPATHVIDLHTASLHRTNLPQVRGDLRNDAVREMAEAFAAPVMVQAGTRDGSLREAGVKLDCPVLLYEGGEPDRFNDEAIRAGVRGIRRVMAALGMRPGSRKRPPPSVAVQASTWIRARRSGILRLDVQLGAEVRRNQVIGVISNVFGDAPYTVRASAAGLIIGMTNNPRVHRGDALVHVGQPGNLAAHTDKQANG